MLLAVLRPLTPLRELNLPESRYKKPSEHNYVVTSASADSLRRFGAPIALREHHGRSERP